MPEDAAQPQGRQVGVFVMTLPASQQPVRDDPIVVFHGGPGGSSSVEALAGAAAGVLAIIDPQRDLILVDQRGSGFSIPFLGCDEGQSVDAVAACHRRLTDQGIDLSQYRSGRIADDFVALRQALGVQRWNLYGGSYGPVPLLLYLQRDPQAVRRIIIDSGTGPQVDIARRDVTNQLNGLQALGAACAAKAACQDALPDLVRQVESLVQALNRRPLTVDPETDETLDGDGLLRLLVQQQQTDARILPGLILAAQERDPDRLQLFANRLTPLDEGFLTLPARVQRRAFSEGGLLAVCCADLAESSYGRIPLRTERRWPARYPTVLTPEYLSLCRAGAFPVPPSPAADRRVVRSAVPALLLAGTLDPVNPPAEVRLTGRGLTRAQFVDVPGATHVLLGQVPGTAAVIRRFLNGTGGPVDATDLTGRATPPFILRPEP